MEIKMAVRCALPCGVSRVGRWSSLGHSEPSTRAYRYMGHHCFLYVHKNLPERNDSLEIWTHTVYEVGINPFSFSV